MKIAIAVATGEDSVEGPAEMYLPRISSRSDDERVPHSFEAFVEPARQLRRFYELYEIEESETRVAGNAGRTADAASAAGHRVLLCAEDRPDFFLKQLNEHVYVAEGKLTGDVHPVPAHLAKPNKANSGHLAVSHILYLKWEGYAVPNAPDPNDYKPRWYTSAYQAAKIRRRLETAKFDYWRNLAIVQAFREAHEQEKPSGIREAKAIITENVSGPQMDHRYVRLVQKLIVAGQAAVSLYSSGTKCDLSTHKRELDFIVDSIQQTAQCANDAKVDVLQHYEMATWRHPEAREYVIDRIADSINSLGGNEPDMRRLYGEPDAKELSTTELARRISEKFGVARVNIHTDVGAVTVLAKSRTLPISIQQEKRALELGCVRAACYIASGSYQGMPTQPDGSHMRSVESVFPDGRGTIFSDERYEYARVPGLHLAKTKQGANGAGEVFLSEVLGAHQETLMAINRGRLASQLHLRQSYGRGRRWPFQRK
ncbi:MAG: hypothetical protein HOQ05_01360 [Corynebacteriales bacterium]|nr:hypothetical protein [Mycobacteriales bacterium]